MSQQHMHVTVSICYVDWILVDLISACQLDRVAVKGCMILLCILQHTPSGTVSIGSQEVQFQAPSRQSSPGPISLELFGMEETQDESLELPVQATITVWSTPVSSSAQADSMLPVTGEPS